MFAILVVIYYLLAKGGIVWKRFLPYYLYFYASMLVL
jgi:hypothetical protein